MGEVFYSIHYEKRSNTKLIKFYFKIDFINSELFRQNLVSTMTQRELINFV